MHDFNEIFKDQFITEKPFTAGMVNASLHLYAYSLTPREMLVKGKALKAKIGLRRFSYFITQLSETGRPLKQKMARVWEDEFIELQTMLADYIFIGYDEAIPEFVHKDIK